jgi:hypothetical protein
VPTYTSITEDVMDAVVAEIQGLDLDEVGDNVQKQRFEHLVNVKLPAVIVALTGKGEENLRYTFEDFLCDVPVGVVLLDRCDPHDDKPLPKHLDWREEMLHYFLKLTTLEDVALCYEVDIRRDLPAIDVAAVGNEQEGKYQFVAIGFTVVAKIAASRERD